MITKLNFSRSDPIYATYYNNRAILYRSQGKFNEAKNFLNEALVIMKRIFGENDLKVAITYSIFDFFKNIKT